MAADTAKQTFEQGALSENLPQFEISSDQLSAGLGIIQAVTLSGMANSNGEARRHIKGNAIKLNDERVTDEGLTIADSDFNADGVAKLSFGKKRHVLLTQT